VFRKMHAGPVRMLGTAHVAAGLGSTKDLEDNAALGSKAAEDKAAEDKVQDDKAAEDKAQDEDEGSEDQDKAGDNVVAGRQAQGEALEEAGVGSKAAEVQEEVPSMRGIEAQDTRAEDDSVAQDDSEVEVQDMPEEGKMAEGTKAQEEAEGEARVQQQELVVAEGTQVEHKLEE